MIRKYRHFSQVVAGAARPLAGVLGPRVAALGVAVACCVCAVGCGSDAQDRNLQPAEVGLTQNVKPIFDDGETKLFEVKRGLQFPILQPDAAQSKGLGKDVEPYGRTPWITNQDVKVQLTWTLSNLDPMTGHAVEILIDPWNEFGRYYPGMQLADAEEQKFEPNLSGIDHYYVLDPASSGESSRRHGTFTFDDMNELAIDFATVMAMIKTPPPLPNGAKDDGSMMTDPLPIYANHAFNVQNRSYNDPLVAPYIPQVIAGLTGIDFGFRTEEPATVALEIAIEIVDQGTGHVQVEGENKTLLKPTTVVVTVGSPVPAATMTTAAPPDPATM
jgi:hypothetical protein